MDFQETLFNNSNKSANLLVPLKNYKAVRIGLIICVVLSTIVSLLQISFLSNESLVTVQYLRIVLHNLWYFTASIFGVWFFLDYNKKSLSRLPFFRLVVRILITTVIVTMLATLGIQLSAFYFGYQDFSVGGGFNVLIVNSLLTTVIVYCLLQCYHFYYDYITRAKADLQNQITQLESRLNPVFFFNSINSIHRLIKDDDHPEAYLEKFSQFYRLTSKKPSLIKLEEEITICNLFVALKQVNLEKSIDISWNNEIQSSLANSNNISLPSTIIQSLLEVMIAFSEDDNQKKITFNGTIEHINGKVTIKIIANNIISYNFEELRLSSKEILDNCNQRLKIYFGDTAEINLVNINEQYVMILLSYPLFIVS